MFTTGEHTNEAKADRTIRRLARLVRQAEYDDFYREHADMGWTWCARQLGIPASQVRSRVVRIGIQQPKRYKTDSDLILSYYHRGLCNVEIADAVGISDETVRVFLRERGLPSNATNESRRIGTRAMNLKRLHNVDTTAKLVRLNRLKFCESLGWCCEEPSASITCEALLRIGVPATRYDVKLSYLEIGLQHEGQFWMPRTWHAALRWCKWLQDRDIVVATGRGNLLRLYQLSPNYGKVRTNGYEDERRTCGKDRSA